MHVCDHLFIVLLLRMHATSVFICVCTDTSRCNIIMWCKERDVSSEYVTGMLFVLRHRYWIHSWLHHLVDVDIWGCSLRSATCCGWFSFTVAHSRSLYRLHWVYCALRFDCNIVRMLTIMILMRISFITILL